MLELFGRSLSLSATIIGALVAILVGVLLMRIGVLDDVVLGILQVFLLPIRLAVALIELLGDLNPGSIGSSPPPTTIP